MSGAVDITSMFAWDPKSTAMDRSRMEFVRFVNATVIRIPTIFFLGTVLFLFIARKIFH